MHCTITLRLTDIRDHTQAYTSGVKMEEDGGGGGGGVPVLICVNIHTKIDLTVWSDYIPPLLYATFKRCMHAHQPQAYTPHTQ